MSAPPPIVLPEGKDATRSRYATFLRNGPELSPVTIHQTLQAIRRFDVMDCCAYYRPDAYNRPDFEKHLVDEAHYGETSRRRIVAQVTKFMRWLNHTGVRNG